MSKSIIAGTALFLGVLLVGSYFFLVGGNKQSSSIVLSSYSNTDKERPKVEVKETLADLGTMKVSDKKSYDFIIKNVGKKPLQLFGISSSCGCTVGQVIIDGVESEEFGMHSQSDYISEILPQKIATIRVTYRPFIMPVYGLVERELYVSTNDPENSKLLFKVKANVK